MTNSNINLNVKALALPYIHSIVIPFILFGIFGNPLLAAAYLAIPAVIYLTVKKDKSIEFSMPAIIVASILIAGWADSVPMP